MSNEIDKLREEIAKLRERVAVLERQHEAYKMPPLISPSPVAPCYPTWPLVTCGEASK